MVGRYIGVQEGQAEHYWGYLEEEAEREPPTMPQVVILMQMLVHVLHKNADTCYVAPSTRY